MAVIEPMTLSDNGWMLYQKCKCGGIRKWKYRNPSFEKLELHWHVGFFQFKIMNGNTTKVGLTPIGKMEIVLLGIQKEFSNN